MKSKQIDFAKEWPIKDEERYKQALAKFRALEGMNQIESLNRGSTFMLEIKMESVVFEPDLVYRQRSFGGHRGKMIAVMIERELDENSVLFKEVERQMLEEHKMELHVAKGFNIEWGDEDVE